MIHDINNEIETTTIFFGDALHYPVHRGIPVFRVKATHPALKQRID
jgi:hypothetical protein